MELRLTKWRKPYSPVYETLLLYFCEYIYILGSLLFFSFASHRHKYLYI